MKVSDKIEDLAFDTIVEMSAEEAEELGIQADPEPLDVYSMYPMVVAVDENGEPVYAKDADGNIITPEAVLEALSKAKKPKLR